MDNVSYFDSLDDTTLELVCQKLIDQNDYQTLSHLLKMNRRINRVCRKFTDMFRDDRIILLISRMVEKEEGSEPVAYITLDHLSSFIKDTLQRYQEDAHIYHDLILTRTFYITIPILNESIEPEGTFDLQLVCQDVDPSEGFFARIISFGNKDYDWDNPQTYQRLRSFIKKQYLKKISKKK